MEQVSIISILSIVIPSLSAILSISYATYRIGKKFCGIDERFKQIDERFKAIDKRFEYIDKRFDELKKYVDSRFNELKSYVDDKFSELRSYVDYKVDRLGKAFSSYQEFFIEYLSVKGVVSEQEATMLKNEAARLSTLAIANPFTKEEWDKLKKYLEKDPKEFTLKEAEEFRELGRKAIVEYGDRPEAYKLHLYTCIVYGLTLRRVYEEKEKKKKQIEQQQSS